MDEHDRIAQPRIDPSRTPFSATAAFNRFGLTHDPDPHSPEPLYLKALIREQGFDSLPDIVRRRDLDQFVTAGEVELFRGVTEARFADELRDGDFFIGRGGEVDGMYAAAGPHALVVARLYAAIGDGTVIRMTLKRGARVIVWDELALVAATERERSAVGSPDVGRFLYTDPSRFAAYRGYDAIHVVEFPEIDNYVVLNRTALRVQKENVR